MKYTYRQVMKKDPIEILLGLQLGKDHEVHNR